MWPALSVVTTKLTWQLSYLVTQCLVDIVITNYIHMVSVATLHRIKCKSCNIERYHRENTNPRTTKVPIGCHPTSLRYRLGGCAQSITMTSHKRHVVSNHQSFGYLFKLKRTHIKKKNKKTWKFALLALCEGNSPVTGDFPTKKGQ